MSHFSTSSSASIVYSLIQGGGMVLLDMVCSGTNAWSLKTNIF